MSTIPPAASGPPAPARRIRVLLVDDNSDYLELCAATLSRQARLEIVGAAHSGPEALELAAALSPEVVVTDLSMPHMSGIEVTRQLRHRSNPPKVLVLTQHDHEAYRQAAAEAGAQGYVTKDEVATALLPTVLDLCGLTPSALPDPASAPATQADPDSATGAAVEIPALAETGGASPAEPTEPARRRIEILLISPSLPERQAAAQILIQAGLDVDTAATGTEGLARASALRPELVLLWPDLPDLSGLEVCRRLKTNLELAGLFVVFLLPRTPPRERDLDWLASGGDGFLSHPLEAAELIARVRFHLGQQRALRILREEQALLQTIVETSPALLVLIDAQGRILRFNQACETLTGYRRAEVLGRRLAELLLPPGEIARFQETLSLRVPSEATPPHEQAWLTREGEIRLIEWHYRRFQLPADGGPCLLGAGVDVTRRRQKEAQLQASEENLRLAQRIGRVGSWEFDLRTRQLWWSEETYRLFGCDPAGFQPAEDSFRNLVHPEDVPLVEAAVVQAIQVTRHYQVEHRIRLPDGSERVMAELAKVLEDPTGQPLRMVGTVQDITERRHAETARARLEIQLRQAQKMEAIGTLAGGIAHDFNNILSAIIGYTELARADQTNAVSVASHLEAVLQAGQRAKHLVRQILTFSRRQEASRSILPLQPVIAEALQLLRASLPSTLEFQVRIDPAVPCVLADPTQLHQVLLNLVTNAAHAMRSRPGCLRIAYEAVELANPLAPELPGTIPGRYARLTVADSGHGMDAATLERIYDPFFTTKPPGEGTGLGLSVVHGIIREHGGHITVASQPGVGTTFHLYLPILHGPPPPASAEVNRLSGGRGERILFVDDEPTLALLARKALEKFGYQVIACTRPDQALDLIRADGHIFDLMIADLTMPVMSGLELAMTVRQILPSLPMLLTTGDLGALAPESIKAAGIHAVLSKPATAPELQHAIRLALESAPPGVRS